MNRDLKAYHVTDESGYNSIINQGILYNYNRWHSQDTDFGYGFYVHAEIKKAEKYAERVAKYDEAYTKYILEFDVSNQLNLLNIKEFNEYNTDFAEFIFHNRIYNINGSNQHKYDIISGCMSDSAPLIVIKNYNDNIISKNEAIIQLMKSTSAKQVCFCSEIACSMLKFCRAYLYNTQTKERSDLR